MTGNGVHRPKTASKVAAKLTSKVVTRGGAKYTQVTRKDGSIVLRPVVAAPVVVTLPEAPARRRVATPSKTARRTRRGRFAQAGAVR